jgi:transposase
MNLPTAAAHNTKSDSSPACSPKRLAATPARTKRLESENARLKDALAKKSAACSEAKAALRTARRNGDALARERAAHSVTRDRLRKRDAEVRELRSEVRKSRKREAEWQGALEALADYMSRSAEIDGKLRHRVAMLNRALFGRSSERTKSAKAVRAGAIDEGKSGVRSGSGGAASGKDADAGAGGARPGAGNHRSGRKALPADLPRIPVHINATEDGEPPCCPCGQRMSPAGYRHAGSKLRLVPAHFVVDEFLAQHFVCRNPYCNATEEERSVTAKPPPAMHGQGFPAPETVASIVVNKFLFSMPLYRQTMIFALAGLALARSSMSKWLKRFFQYLVLLWEMMLLDLRESDYLHVDETRLRLLSKKVGRYGNIWHFGNDGCSPKRLMFVYSDKRSAEVLQEILGNDYSGYLQSDDHSSYNTYKSKNGSVKPVRCLAHIRRHFEKVVALLPKPDGTTYAERIFAIINRIYELDGEIRETTDDGTSPDEILALREKLVLRQYFKLKRMLRTSAQYFPNSLHVGKGIAYGLRNVGLLKPYFEDSRIRLDNNLAENAIRPVAVGRKNWLFCARSVGARMTVVFLSVLWTALAFGLDPYEYLVHLARQLPRCVSVDDAGKATVTDPAALRALLPENRLAELQRARASP